MKIKTHLIALLGLALVAIFFSCQPNVPASWQKFMDCANTNCVAEVVAVKDDFLKDPKPIFEEFVKTDQRGEDHYIGWLYLLRDSVLVNRAFGTTEARFAMQQAIVGKAQPFENDPKFGSFAKSIIDEIGTLAIASELEDDVVEQESITGTYAYELPKDAGSGEIEILDNGDNTIRFSISVVGPAPAYNQGMMEGTASYVDFTATINTTEYGGKCTIELDFAPDHIEAKTLAGDDAKCGFGHNVRADGTYQKKDDLNPFLEVPGDEIPTKLEGIWVSTTDPKSEIVIGDGKYIEVYNTEAGPKMPMSYHKSCPKDCNPVADMPCIQVHGQDVVCYTVVKADGKTLELSMVGGTGNTLVYKAKG